jgi:hypothetical protein
MHKYGARGKVHAKRSGEQFSHSSFYCSMLHASFKREVLIER